MGKRRAQQAKIRSKRIIEIDQVHCLRLPSGIRNTIDIIHNAATSTILIGILVLQLTL